MGTLCRFFRLCPFLGVQDTVATVSTNPAAAVLHGASMFPSRGPFVLLVRLAVERVLPVEVFLTRVRVAALFRRCN